MIRTPFFRAVLAGQAMILLGSATLPVYAAPRKPAKTRPVVKALPGQPVSTAKGIVAAPPGDRQKLVTLGKLPPFFDPADLSKFPVLSAASAILMDADTGQVLWAKNADAPRAPASTTKIMTALLFIEHSNPTDVITCLDPKITQIEESSLHIKPWEKFSAEDLLYGFMLRSGNDGAVLIAQHVAGSVPKFAQMMNKRAEALGATHTHFVNPNGLPAKGHLTTARDLALIACEALKNPRFAECVGTPERTITRSLNQNDTHITMRVKKYFYDKFPGADGVKTGYTRQAGHCFVASATRDGRRLLSVTLGAPLSASSDSIPLLSWGFQRFPSVPVVAKNQTVGPVPIRGGMQSAVSAVTAGDLHATVDPFAVGGTPPVTQQIRPADVSAPVMRGQVVGTLAALVDGKPVAHTDLLATEDVPAAPVAAAVTQLTNAAQAGGGRIWWPVGITGASLIALGYGAAFTKSHRRRRSHVAAAGRGDDRLGSRTR